MTRPMLLSLAIAVVLSASAAAPAASGDAFQIISAGKSTVTPSRRGQSLSGSEMKKKKQKSKYHELKLDHAKISPWRPQASKQDHKGEIEIHSVSPGASPSARSPKKRRLQAK